MSGEVDQQNLAPALDPALLDNAIAIWQAKYTLADHEAGLAIGRLTPRRSAWLPRSLPCLALLALLALAAQPRDQSCRVGWLVVRRLASRGATRGWVGAGRTFRPPTRWRGAALIEREFALPWCRSRRFRSRRLGPLWCRPL